MGNQLSVPQRAEEEEHHWEASSYKVTSDDECAQNGTPVIISTRTTQHYDEVGLEISVQKDNVATSSPNTMEIGTAAVASGKNLGKEAKPEAPAVKSRFFLAFSRPVPGRPGDQGTDSSTQAAKLDVSSNSEPANKDPSDSPALCEAAAQGPATDKIPAPSTTPGDQALPATWAQAPLPPEPVAAAPSKSKDSSFFDKFFKLDKGREKAAAEDQRQEAQEATQQGKAEEVPGLSGPPHGGPAGEDIADGQETEGREIESSQGSISGDLEGLRTAEEDAQTTDTTASNTSIMSFFRTLVSPNKAETKKDPEDTKASKAEIVCDGQAGQKMAETQAKGSKKKHLESPRLGLTFRKFFRHQGAEKSPSTPAKLKSDKANSPPRETQSPKGCPPPGQAPSTATSGTAKEGDKEKTGPTSLPLGKLFWKKSVKEESVPTGAQENVVCESPVETVKSEEVESPLQTAELSEERGTPPAPADTKGRREGRPRRTSLMALLRQVSVRGDGGISHSEKINGKDSDNQTSNPTEKAPTPKATTPPPEPEPTAATPKGKEGPSKDKKAAAAMNKRKSSRQEAEEPARCAEQAAVQVSALQNGDRAPKRPEKRRQSLGGFLKGLGPKRMSDAQVQTDPVSIGPPGKSK
ncbi:breast carcinoma-amplified sequence 1 isoform X1 [Cavia porcellus]|uniref:breast carcinoma-amplified sequence 1 isoform X1 n=1 Tax=Cavia porcellus TaxID=10141 RepID=UPI000184CA44|nr:breast carcinoma-amplified sequence 1 isoform X1 [Cavia porcellus]